MFSVKIILCFAFLVAMSGCGIVRLAPSEQQKQNAWLLKETTAAAAEIAIEQEADKKLTDLVKLASRQSQAVVLDYGLPEDTPDSGLDDLLSARTLTIAEEAIYDSNRQSSDSSIISEIIIVLVGLFSGAAGIQYIGSVKKKINS